MKYALVIDSGTTSVRAALVDTNGYILDMVQKEIALMVNDLSIHQDANEIYESSYYCLETIIKKHHLSSDDILGLGITNQRETTILFDKEGNPYVDAIVWQSKESEPIVNRWKQKGYISMVQQKTGLLIDAYFSASKIRYLFEQYPDLYQKALNHQLFFGTVDTWLIYKLTKGQVFATDGSNASRTMLFNIHNYSWDDELLDKFDIPSCILPNVKESIDDFGTTTIADVTMNIISVLGDQQAATLGDGCTSYGNTKVTYGTGGFVVTNTGDYPLHSNHQMVSTIAWKINGKVTYGLEGSVFIAGAAISWLKDELGIINSAKESEAIANMVPDSDGVVVVPSFTGLGAPYWNGKAKALICGINRDTTYHHIVYATLQAIACSIDDVLLCIKEDLHSPLSLIVADGGASANNLLLQMQSNISDTQLIRYEEIESTLLGVAYAIFYHHHIIDSLDAIKKLKKVDQTFSKLITDEKQATIRQQWQNAMQLVITYANSNR